MTRQLFLSASIPIAGRPPFDQDVQAKRIRNAVMALVTVCRDQNLQLVFGGHPLISPLVHHAANRLGIVGNIFIYQSKFYEKKLPEAARKFPNLIWTEAKSDGTSSVDAMRDRMINAQEWSYSGAIFIGGMEGIFDEAQRFHEAYPDKPMIPLEETGGATRLLMREVDPKERFAWRLPDAEDAANSMLRYRSLLAKLLTVK